MNLLTVDQLVSEEPHLNAANPLIVLLHQLSEVIENLTDRQYAMKPVGIVDSSIGGHVRHCLDHVSSFLDAVDTGNLNYDHRRRNTSIETSRSAALARVDELIAQLRDLRSDFVDQSCTLQILLSPDEPPISVNTTLGRELAYAVSHTIHHNALIDIMLRILGHAPPAGFGYAPSTIAHERRRQCAQ